MTQLVNDLDNTAHVKEEVADHAPIPEAGNRYDGMLACSAAMAEWQPWTAFTAPGLASPH